MEAQSVPRSGGLSLRRSRRFLAPLSDDRLVEHARRGNDAAFEVIFERHHRGILSFCRHMLASVEEAEDAVQHTFIQAYDAIRRTDRDLQLKAWLYAVARNRCLSVLRARREQTAELDDIPTAGLSDEVQQRSELRDLLADMQELPEEQRAALVLSELGDLSHTEIATVVGCEASKVKSLVFQARSSLIESRNAREVPCHEIREQLATATGGALRRGPLRRHVKQCAGCTEFRDQVARQRRAMAALLPVVPSVALKQGALGALGIGGGASAAAGGGGLAGGGLAAIGTTTAGKAVTILALAGVAVSGGVAVTKTISGAEPEANSSAAHSAPAPGFAPAGAGPGLGALGAKSHGGTAGTRAHTQAGAGGKHAGSSKPAGAGGAAPHKGGHNHAHANGSPLPENHGTAIAPGLNGTAGQGQPNGVGNNRGTDNGRHNGALNGNANGRTTDPPNPNGHNGAGTSSDTNAHGTKPDKAATGAVPSVPTPGVSDPTSAVGSPGAHLGSKNVK
jgi:RNA polymerase sigma factor (sigma-70 family)